MSQIVVIKSKLKIENISLAKQALSGLNIRDVDVDETGFQYQGYQHDDGLVKRH